MKKLFASIITALLIAALLCPLALMEEDIAPEPVDAPVELSDAVELSDEIGGEMLEAEAEFIAPENISEGDADSIPIDEAHFPDPAFRKIISDTVDGLYIVGNGYNYGEKDGYLSKAESELVVRIGEDGYRTVVDVPVPQIKIVEINWVTGKPTWTAGITSLQGCEYFPNLAEIDCQYNPISVLDVSKCKKLEQLLCYNCGMTSLNISGCENLLSVGAVNNELTSVEVPNSGYFAGFPTGFKSYKQPASFLGKNIYRYSKSIQTIETISGKFIDASITVDKKVKVTGSNGSMGGSGSSSAPAVPASFTNTSEGVTVTVDASSTANNTVAAVVATPGTVTQLDLSGATGKKFKSSNKKVATVNKNGVVTFKGPGKVKITYKVGKKTRKVTLTVTDPTFPSTIALNLIGTVPAKVGEPQTLVATLNEGAVSGIRWKSNKKNIATVKNGVVTFKKPGTVNITAITTRGKKKASVTFIVTK